MWAQSDSKHFLQQIGFKNMEGVQQVPLTQEKAVQLVKDVFISAAERDVYTGDALRICVVTKEGLTEQTVPLRKDWRRKMFLTFMGFLFGSSVQPLCWFPFFPTRFLSTGVLILRFRLSFFFLHSKHPSSKDLSTSDQHSYSERSARYLPLSGPGLWIYSLHVAEICAQLFFLHS